MNFNNIYAHGIARVAAATFEVTPGNPHANAEKIIELAHAAAKSYVSVLVFPRDCLNGVTVGDWGENTAITTATGEALVHIARKTSALKMLTVVGARIAGHSRAMFISEGQVLDDDEFTYGFVADDLPQLWVFPLVGENPIREYTQAISRISLGFAGPHAPNTPAGPFGTPIPVAPGAQASPGTPTLLVNLAAPPHTVGALRQLHHSARQLSHDLGLAVVQAVGSRGESSTDGSYTAAGFVAVEGHVLASEEHLAAGGLTIADIVLPEISTARKATNLHYPGWIDSGIFTGNANLDEPIPMLEPPAQRPLVPASTRRYHADLREAFGIQTAGLMRRLSALRDSNIVLGLSGGLDSTLALLVAVAAKTGHEGILAFTMPGFATSAGTKSAALRLAAALGVDCETIDIRATATEMLRTMGHPAGSGEPVYDVTFENVQAGLRADYLFRLANQRGGFVLGTGDLSEAALGWCTYGVGDHMSHYGVNGGVPKSLMPDLIRVAVEVLCERGLVVDQAALHEVIAEIISADITPELVPDHTDAGGVAQHQTTEGTIGPYILHDFFLYHTLRGASPRLVAFLALAAFESRESASQDEDSRYFTREEILKWLRVFYRRFLTQQFKRTASVASPVIWEGMSLSPRTGYRFPDDLSPEAVLADLENL